MKEHPGLKFRRALLTESPLQVVGTINAFTALLALHAGFKAIYLSGAGVANASYGLPDNGTTTFENVLEDVKRITSAVDLPLLVDIDTGFTISHTIKLIEKAKAAGVQIEDQPVDKKCGHLPFKKVIPKEEMCDRIRACVKAREHQDFVIVARTDALAVEGFERTIQRGMAYKNAGADLIFAEAFESLEQYKAFKKAVHVPIIANITEWGKTPLYTLEELKSAQVDVALYPLSAMRAMNQAALQVYEDIKTNGTQKKSLKLMMTREELYQHLNYKGYAS